MGSIVGTVVGAKVVPTDTADVYGTHDALYGAGGWRTVADITARNAIPDTRRQIGMVVYVEDADGWGHAATYQLIGGITNSDWAVHVAGLTGTGITDRFASWASATDMSSAPMYISSGNIYTMATMTVYAGFGADAMTIYGQAASHTAFPGTQFSIINKGDAEMALYADYTNNCNIIFCNNSSGSVPGYISFSNPNQRLTLQVPHATISNELGIDTTESTGKLNITSADTTAPTIVMRETGLNHTGTLYYPSDVYGDIRHGYNSTTTPGGLVITGISDDTLYKPGLTLQSFVGAETAGTVCAQYSALRLDSSALDASSIAHNFASGILSIMTLMGDGKVGMGTTIPTSRLSVLLDQNSGTLATGNVIFSEIDQESDGTISSDSWLYKGYGSWGGVVGVHGGLSIETELSYASNQAGIYIKKGAGSGRGISLGGPPQDIIISQPTGVNKCGISIIGPTDSAANGELYMDSSGTSGTIRHTGSALEILSSSCDINFIRSGTQVYHLDSDGDIAMDSGRRIKFDGFGYAATGSYFGRIPVKVWVDTAWATVYVAIYNA